MGNMLRHDTEKMKTLFFLLSHEVAARPTPGVANVPSLIGSPLGGVGRPPP